MSEKQRCVRAWSGLDARAMEAWSIHELPVAGVGEYKRLLKKVPGGPSSEFRFPSSVYGNGGVLDISSFSLGGQAWQRQ